MTVSVLMGVRNGSEWLKDALGSLWTQTEPPHEVIVVDDGSTDDTAVLLREQSDRNPTLLWTRQPALGLATALNRAARLATGDYLARLDADDLALGSRMEAQRRSLDAHPDVVLLGAWAFQCAPGGRDVTQAQPPIGDADLRRALRWRNPFLHSTVMLRRAAFEQVGAYDEGLPVCQDFDLWQRLALIGQVANLPVALAILRDHPGRVSRVHARERRRMQWLCRWRAWRRGL